MKYMVQLCKTCRYVNRDSCTQNEKYSSLLYGDCSKYEESLVENLSVAGGT